MHLDWCLVPCAPACWQAFVVIIEVITGGDVDKCLPDASPGVPFIICLLVSATWHFQRTISKSADCPSVGKGDHSSCSGGISLFTGTFLRRGTLALQTPQYCSCSWTSATQYHWVYLVTALYTGSNIPMPLEVALPLPSQLRWTFDRKGEEPKAWEEERKNPDAVHSEHSGPWTFGNLGWTLGSKEGQSGKLASNRQHRA